MLGGLIGFFASNGIFRPTKSVAIVKMLKFFDQQSSSIQLQILNPVALAQPRGAHAVILHHGTQTILLYGQIFIQTRGLHDDWWYPKCD